MRLLVDLVPRYLAMQRMLIKAPASKGDIARKIGCTYDTASRWITAFEAADAVEFAGFGIRKSRKGTFPSLYRWKQ